MIWSVGLRLINVTHYARPLYGPTRLICICIGTDHRVVCSRGLLSERTSSCPELSIQPLPFQPRLPPSWLRPGRLSRTENQQRSSDLERRISQQITIPIGESKSAGSTFNRFDRRSHAQVDYRRRQNVPTIRKVSSIDRSQSPAIRNRVGVHWRPV